VLDDNTQYINLLKDNEADHEEAVEAVCFEICSEFRSYRVWSFGVLEFQEFLGFFFCLGCTVRRQDVVRRFGVFRFLSLVSFEVFAGSHFCLV
jgi:hypothetical protein